MSALADLKERMNRIEDYVRDDYQAIMAECKDIRGALAKLEEKQEAVIEEMKKDNAAVLRFKWLIISLFTIINSALGLYVLFKQS